MTFSGRGRHVYSFASFHPLPFFSMSIASMIDLLETHPYHTLIALFFGSIILVYPQLKKARANPKGLPLPPGPKGYPLLGNLFDMPVDKAWLVYNDWYKTYGRTFTTLS